MQRARAVAMELLWYIVLGFVFAWSSKIVLVAALACAMAFITLVMILLLLVMILVLLVLILLVSIGLSFVTEPLRYKIKRALGNFRRSPLAEADAWPGWDMIAELKPGFGEIFERVIVCDSNQFDDPLYPHVSIIYMIGVTARASYWYTFTIWRVSTVTGRREYVCHFNWFDWTLFFDPFTFRVTAFYSKNAVFVYVWRRYGFGSSSLFLYDIRNRKWAKYRLGRPLAIQRFFPMAIPCLGRRMKQGTVDGWRIRFLAVGTCDDTRGLVFTNMMIDLSASGTSSSAIVAQEDLISRFTPYFARPVAHVRSQHQFGLFHLSNIRNNVGILVHHAKSNRFQIFKDFKHFTNSDATLTKIHRRGIGMYREGRIPMVLNDREVIQATEPERDTIPSALGNTAVMRVWLKAPTLRMAAVQSAFDNIPALATMQADQFRRATGVDLAGHFMG